jgi:hypothetical protein
MAFVFGTLQASAYNTFFLGIWAFGISAVCSVVAIGAILLSRCSSAPLSSLEGVPAVFART